MTIVTEISHETVNPKVRIGRRPINGKAMTPAERKRRSRAKAAAPPPGRRLQSFHLTNAGAIAAASTLYIRDDAVVVDATFGLGQFWTKTDTARFTLIGSDIAPKASTVQADDLRRLPYGVGTVDVVVLDPPYTWNGHLRMTKHDRFGGSTAPETLDDVLELYRAGMTEARRVLKPRGRLFVKGMDQVDKDSRQFWFSRKLPRIAEEELGMFMRDEFIVKANKPPGVSQWKQQHHAHKMHSFLLIFERQPRKRASEAA